MPPAIARWSRVHLALALAVLIGIAAGYGAAVLHPKPFEMAAAAGPKLPAAPASAPGLTQAQVTQLAASKIPTVVAVSCNVTTFARDAKILIDGGYSIESVTPVDQFRHTPHVELVARFSK